MDNRDTLPADKSTFAISNKDFDVPLFESISIAGNKMEHTYKTSVAIQPISAPEEV